MVSGSLYHFNNPYFDCHLAKASNNRFLGGKEFVIVTIFQIRSLYFHHFVILKYKRMFEKSFSVDFTTPASEKRVRENKGFGVCDRPPELHLRLNLTLFKHPLRKIQALYSTQLPNTPALHIRFAYKSTGISHEGFI